MQLPRHQYLRLRRNRRIIAKSDQPVHQRLLAEPRQLALGVVPRGLHNRFSSGRQRDRAFQVRAKFPVSDKVKRFRIQRYAVMQQTSNFRKPAAFEHGVGAPLDALIQRGPWRLQANLDRAVTFKASAARLMNFTLRPPREQADFNGADHLRTVARADAQGGFRVQPPQQAVQVLKRVLLGQRLKTHAQFLRTRWGVSKPLQQSAQVESRTHGKDRQPGPLAQVLQDGYSSNAIFPRRERKRRVHQIEQVMRNAFAFLDGGLGGADIKTAIDLS